MRFPVIKISYFISTLINYIFEYIYNTFIYVTLLFLNILFAINIHFTYKCKHTLIIGMVFSELLVHYEHLEVFECPVATWSVTSRDISLHKQLCTFDSKCHRPEIRFKWMQNYKSNKTKLFFLCGDGCRGEGNLWISFILKYFTQAVTTRWFTQHLLWPLRDLVWPPGEPYGPLL